MESFIKNLARGAGKILRDGFRTEFKIDHKTAVWDVVTEFDLASEKFLIDKIKRRFPNHGILSEETGLVGRKKYIRVIDPLDGSIPFSRGYAQFAVSIGFVTLGQIRYGVVHDPIADEFFYAKRGKGAYLNGKKISIAKPEDLHFGNTYLALGTGLATDYERRFIYNKLVIPYQLWQGGVMACALSLAYTAAGRLDVAITRLPPWDNCAGALLLQEAGAKVTDFKGRPYRWDKDELVAASPKLHKEAIKVLRKL